MVLEQKNGLDRNRLDVPIVSHQITNKRFKYGASCRIEIGRVFS